MKHLALIIGVALTASVVAQDKTAALKKRLETQKTKVAKLQRELDADHGAIERKIHQMTDIAKSIRDSQNSKGDAVDIKEDTMKALGGLIKFYKAQQKSMENKARYERSATAKDIWEEQIRLADGLIEKRVNEIVEITATLNRYAGLSGEDSGDVSEGAARDADKTAKKVRRALDKSIDELRKDLESAEKKLARARKDSDKKDLGEEVKRLSGLVKAREDQLLKTATGKGKGGRAIGGRDASDIQRRLRKVVQSIKADYQTLLKTKRSADKARRDMAVLADQWKKATGKEYEMK